VTTVVMPATSAPTTTAKEGAFQVLAKGGGEACAVGAGAGGLRFFEYVTKVGLRRRRVF
jgi:hypothetical protein